MSAVRVAGLVLAAGRSSRMRSGHKLLADLGGLPVIARTVDSLVASASLDSVTVILGDRADAVRDAIGGRRVRTLVAPDHRLGLSASLARGLAALRDGAGWHQDRPDGILIALGDMPLVEAATIRAVVDRFRALRQAGEAAPVVRPARDGTPGHPILWHRSHAAALSAVTGDGGGRLLLETLGASVSRVRVDDGGIGFDIDTDEALLAARRFLEAR